MKIFFFKLVWHFMFYCYMVYIIIFNCHFSQMKVLMHFKFLMNQYRSHLKFIHSLVIWFTEVFSCGQQKVIMYLVLMQVYYLSIIQYTFKSEILRYANLQQQLCCNKGLICISNPIQIQPDRLIGPTESIEYLLHRVQKGRGMRRADWRGSRLNLALLCTTRCINSGGLTERGVSFLN